MARTKTLLELRTTVRKRADCVGDTTTGRHTNAEINAAINDSWQAMRELVSKNNQLYLKPAVATFAQGATAPYAWNVISLPEDCFRIYGFDVQVSARDIRTLLPMSFGERNEFMGHYGQNVGIPQGFFLYNLGTELNAGVTAGKVGIIPAPDAGYQYTLWYLPAWTAVTSDSNVFDGVAGWDDWVVEDVVLKLAETDNDMSGTAQLALQRQAAALARLMDGAGSASQTGPVRRIDVAGMRSRNAADVRWRR
jgi:hypothetical protein